MEIVIVQIHAPPFKFAIDTNVKCVVHRIFWSNSPDSEHKE